MSDVTIRRRFDRTVYGVYVDGRLVSTAITQDAARTHARNLLTALALIGADND